MTYLPHQTEKAAALADKVKAHGLGCLWGEPRSGKTRTAILACEQLPIDRVLVLTKKNAIGGWREELAATKPDAHYHVTNYEQAPKLDPALFQLVIVDESHNLNKVGRPTQRYRNVRRLAGNKPCIMLSGTPAIERVAGLYYQLTVTRYSPFARFKNFYDFFRAYGIPHGIWVNGRSIEQYDRVKPDVLDEVEPHVVRMTQAEAGIEAQAEDQVHTVELGPDSKALIRQLMRDGVGTVAGRELVLDSDMAVRAAVHQIETGALKIDDEMVELENCEVVNYIRQKFGDKASTAVMAHYHSTRMKIAKHLPNVEIFSSDAHAEGTSLADYKHFVIVNTVYSGAKHVQRRERGVNINKTEAAVVHHIVTDAGVSRAVYRMVSKKHDFNLRMFRDLRRSA